MLAESIVIDRSANDVLLLPTTIDVKHMLVRTGVARRVDAQPTPECSLPIDRHLEPVMQVRGAQSRSFAVTRRAGRL